MTKEGLLFPLPFLIMAAVFYFLFNKLHSIPMFLVAIVLFYLGMLVMLFFRDPDRKVPSGEKLILSPADGKIIRIDNIDCEPSISIFLSIFNVHINRAPVSGIVRRAQFFPGKFHIASRHEAMTENQRNEIEIETDNGIVGMHQVSGSIARRTIFRQKPGEPVVAGQRVGLIRFGSRVDLFLPEGTRIDIQIGQKVVAGETILGHLP